MGINGIRLAVHDVHATAVGAPSRNARGKMLVGVGDAPVVLFLEFVFFRVRSGIAPLPEVLDELVALRIGGQLLEGRHLFIGDDPAHVLIEPALVILGFFFQCGFALLFFGDGALERVLRLVLLRLGNTRA